MRAGDHDIQSRKQPILEVQLAFGQNVHFRSGQKPEIDPFAFQALVERGDFCNLCDNPLWGQTICLNGRTGMIGNRPIIAAEFIHELCDLLEGIAAIAPVGMIVQ